MLWRNDFIIIIAWFNQCSYNQIKSNSSGLASSDVLKEIELFQMEYLSGFLYELNGCDR